MVKEKVTCGAKASAGIERWLVQIINYKVTKHNQNFYRVGVITGVRSKV